MSEKESGYKPIEEGAKPKERNKDGRRQEITKVQTRPVETADDMGDSPFIETSNLQEEVERILKAVEKELGLEIINSLRRKYTQAVDRGLYAIEKRVEIADPTSSPTSERSALFTKSFADLEHAIHDAVENNRSASREDRLIPELNTRQQMSERFDDLLRSLSDKEQLVFISMDLDEFKKINDVFGHEMGDQVLRSFGIALFDSIYRADDVAGHFSGDEFGLILKMPIKNYDGKDVDVQVIVSRIIENVQINTIRPVLSNDGRSEKQKVSTGFVRIFSEQKDSFNFEIARERSDQASEFSKLLEILLEIRGNQVDSKVRIVDHASIDELKKEFSAREVSIAKYVRGMKREAAELGSSENLGLSYSLREMVQIAELMVSGEMKKILKNKKGL